MLKKLENLTKFIQYYQLTATCKGIIICFVYLFSNSQLPGQHQNWNPKGEMTLDLGGARANDFLQDQHGFVWFSSDKGLWRYDGIQSVNYNANTHPGLPSNYTVCLIEIPSKNEIWIGTHNGLAIYNSHTDKIRNYVFDSLEYNLGFGVHNIVQIDNQVWILGKDLLLFQLDNKKRIKIMLDDLAANENIRENYLSRITRSIIQDSENPDKYWVGTNYGLVFLDKNTKSYKRYFFERDDFIHQWGFNQQIFLYSISKNNILYQTYSWGSFLFNKETKIFSETGIDRSFMENHIGRSAILQIQKSEKSDLSISFKNGKTIHYDINKNKASLIRENNPRFIDMDSSCYYVKPGKVEIAKPRIKGIQIYNLPDYTKWPNSLVDMFEDTLKNALYCLNNRNGLYRLDLTSGVWRIIDIPNEIETRKEFGLNHHLFLSQDSVILLGYNRIWLFDLARDKIELIKSVDISKDFSTNIIMDKDQNIWIGSRDKGLAKWTFDGVEMAYSKELNEDGSFHGTHVYKLLVDQNNHLWIRTRTGHSVIDLDNNLTTNYPYQSKLDSTFVGVNDFLEDLKGNIWISSDDDLGFVPKNYSGFGVQKINISSSLPSYRKLGEMEMDEDGKIWISTDQDLIRFNPSDFSIHSFPLVGFPANNKNAVLKRISQGRMVYAVENGVLIFHPNQLNAGGKYNQTYIKSVKANGDAISTKLNWFFPQNVHLPSSTKQLIIEFSSISFLNYPEIHFSYLFSGIDDEWNFVGDQRIASYSNLKGGTYIFKLRSLNQSGIWSDAKEWNFNIDTPFQQTLLFRITILGLFLAGIYILYQQNVRKIKQKEEKNTAINKRMAQLEMQALKAQMNPHFIFNSLNSIQNLITKGDDRSSLIYLNKFSKLIREVLENSEKSKISLAEELNILEKYIELESLRFDHQFTYEIEIDKTLTPEEITVPNLLLQPYVENAIHHGIIPKNGNGNLHISVISGEKILQFEITDNGIGREASLKQNKKNLIHRSMGMQVTRERIEIASEGKIQNPVKIMDLSENGNAEGTKVIIRIPKEEL